MIRRKIGPIFRWHSPRITVPHGHALLSLQRDEKASFSYPYLMRRSDGLIALAYTWRSREIRCLTFNERWLGDQAARCGKP